MLHFLVMHLLFCFVYKAHSYMISYLGTEVLIVLGHKYFHNNLSAIL